SARPCAAVRTADESIGLLHLSFAKQKTAYDIGLGIPADRSSDLFPILASNLTSKEAKMGKVMRHTLGASLNIRHNLSSSKGPKRSEERRVGKECRSRWKTCDYKKKTMIQRRQRGGYGSAGEHAAG